MARTKEEREQRRLEAKQRAEQRKAAKEAKASATSSTPSAPGNCSKDENPPQKAALTPNELRQNITHSQTHNQSLPALSLPTDALAKVMRYLPAREWGAVSLTCVGWNHVLAGCRASHLCCRLRGRSGNCGLEFCSGRKEAQDLLERAITSGGETGRLITKKMKRSTKNKEKIGVDVGDADEYPGYARFVEEATIGYSAMQCSRSALFPKHLQGRFASLSPEHSLLRLGGGGSTTSGPGGSGTATWGVGKRGQLGHGKRDDSSLPQLLLGKIGWGVRIVQVAAGGGLVRVAHSLLLTSTGRVLSFGTAQYGQLGHGYDAGKQLSDCLRPRYIDALKHVKCICVAAGELHSGVVTSDGDVYTWGEGFCGQLGLGDRRPHLLPEQVTLGGLEDEVVESLTCGCRHTMAVTEEGEVFSWGLGRFGVLGRSYTDFTYQSDVGMVVPEAEEGQLDGQDGQVRGVAARPPPMPPAEMDAIVNAANAANGANGDVEPNRDGGGLEDIRISLEALNLTLDDPSDQCFPKLIDSLKGFRIVGASAGHRHSMLLDENGGLYTFGSGASGALGHGDLMGQEYPVKVMEFENNNIRIHQMSAGVDMSMAVSTSGTVYAWGKASDGRLGLGFANHANHALHNVLLPRRVEVGDEKFKAVDVECGYVHSLIVGLDGSVYQCGGVGVDGKEDGQDVEELNGESRPGYPALMSGINIWHRIAEPKEKVVKEKWTKYGKYELKGRSKMMNEGVRSIA